jgi:hypothetical protein
MTTRASALLLLGSAVLVGWAAGCGASAHAPAKEPAAPAEQAPAPAAAPAPPPDADGAASELDRAEAELGRLLGEPLADAAPSRGAPAPAATSTPLGGATRPEDKPEERKEKGGAAAPGSTRDACEGACAAMGSMRRAAEHLCELAGPTDGRCEGARVRVRSAEERVRARCPSCAA